MASLIRKKNCQMSYVNYDTTKTKINPIDVEEVWVSLGDTITNFINKENDETRVKSAKELLELIKNFENSIDRKFETKVCCNYSDGGYFICDEHLFRRVVDSCQEYESFYGLYDTDAESIIEQIIDVGDKLAKSFS